MRKIVCRLFEHPKFVQEHEAREKRCLCLHVPNLSLYMMRSDIPTLGVAFEAAQSCAASLPRLLGPRYADHFLKTK